MLELLNEAVSPANMIYTIFLGLAVLYALSVIIGFVGMDAFDFDIDIDTDIDVDSDVDLNGVGAFASALSFFNLGKIPFMFIYCICTLCMWAIGMTLNSNLGNGSVLFTIMTFIPVLFVSLIITKLITTPMLPIFKDMNQGADPTDYIGLQGELLLPLDNARKSQAELNIDGSIHRITVALSKEEKISAIPKGTDIYITGISDDKSFYWVAKDDII